MPSLKECSTCSGILPLEAPPGSLHGKDQRKFSRKFCRRQTEEEGNHYESHQKHSLSRNKGWLKGKLFKQSLTNMFFVAVVFSPEPDTEGFPGGSVKNSPAMWETWVWSLGWEDPLQEGMATHSSILAWRIPWTEEPGELQSMGSQRIRHNWATKQSIAQLTQGKENTWLHPPLAFLSHLSGVRKGEKHLQRHRHGHRPTKRLSSNHRIIEHFHSPHNLTPYQQDSNIVSVG